MQAGTLANLVEGEGEKIQVYVEGKAECILERHGWSTDGAIKIQEKVSEAVKKEGGDASTREGLSNDRRTQLWTRKGKAH